jgi:hypothetical protein
MYNQKTSLAYSHDGGLALKRYFFSPLALEAKLAAL